MGKASETLQQLNSQSLTAAEIEQRRAAVENGGDVQATPDGQLVKLVLGSAQPAREAGRADAGTWD